MIEEIVTIVAVDKHYAWVDPHKKTGCQACSTKSTCSSSGLFTRNLDLQKIKVLNPVHAKLGDVVIVGIPAQGLLLSSIFAYLLPLISLLVFAILGKELFTYMEIFAEYGAISLGIIGLFVGLGLTKILIHRNQFIATNQPVILRFKNENVIKLHHEPISIV